jgi:hypothetical protein
MITLNDIIEFIKEMGYEYVPEWNHAVTYHIDHENHKDHNWKELFLKPTEKEYTTLFLQPELYTKKFTVTNLMGTPIIRSWMWYRDR